MSKPKCPECNEPVEQGRPKGAGSGWSLEVEPRRLEWRHLDREPLCPVVTGKGYQPALPKR